MIRTTILGLMVAGLTVSGNAIAQELETDAQKLGYMFGLDIGKSMRQQGVDIDMDAFFEAVRTAYEGGTPLLTQEEAAQVRQDYIARRQAEMAAEREALSATNMAEGQAFLAANRANEGVVVTDSGLQYQVLESAEGASPAATDRVTVHYRGTLLDGTEFDSSYSRNQPASFALNQVIPGWTEGVQLMTVGSTYRFWIPSELAYGPEGTPNGPIGPNATLIFDVELVSID